MKGLLSLLGIASCLVVQGQTTASFNFGTGSFKMEDLKTYQRELASSFPVDAQVISSFPNYRVYGVDLQWQRPRNIVLGVSFANGSTGGRISYSDYSGSEGGDQLLSFNSYGFLFGGRKSFLNGMLMLQGDIRPALSTTKLTLTTFYHTASTNVSSETHYESQNVTVQPTLSCFFRYKLIGLNASVGYNAALQQGKFWYAGDDNNAPQLEMSADWSGFRATGGVSFFVGPEEPKESRPEDLIVFGLGLGRDYGGVGANVTTYPTRNIGLFVGLGYALAGIGYNGGMKVRIMNKPDPRAYVFLMAMYGYNAAVTVKGASDYDRLFYGPSFGFGVETTATEYRSGQWAFGLIVPIMGDKMENYMNSLKSLGVAFGGKKPWPVGITVGYKISTHRSIEKL